jgi:membrane protein implicated in regulation of membrane protease activity
MLTSILMKRTSLFLLLWVLNALIVSIWAYYFLENAQLFHWIVFLVVFSSFGLLSVVNIKMMNNYLKNTFSSLTITQAQTEDKIEKVIEQASQKTEEYFFVKVDGKIFKVSFDQLLYAESQRNVTKLVLLQQTLQPVMTLSSVEEILPKNQFVRLHRSFIINKSKIDHIEGNRVFIGANEIPIGANYREVFLREIGVGN